jgi:soluble lytic murein transglycosylase
MMLRQYFLSTLFSLIFIILPHSALAGLSGDARMHAESAFSFADRGDWANARLHARQSGELALSKLIDWEYMMNADSGATFYDIVEFLTANPGWPEQKKLMMRAEMALREGNASDEDVLSLFAGREPATGYGRMALARALSRQASPPKDRIDQLVRDAWVGGDFEEPQENEILSSYRSLLTREDHFARASRLLWEEKTSPAKRMLPLLSDAQKKLVEARMALIADKKTAALTVLKVPAELKKDPGLIYDRMRYRARRDDKAGVREMLKAAPATVPYPEKWWRYRETQVRKAIDEGNIKLAQALLQHHGQVDGIERADAVWLSGWLELEFLNHPKKAYDIFYHMYDAVKYPPSRARAAYWAGRAAEESGDKDASANWYNTASSYPTTFYGQLAALKHHGKAPLRMPAPLSVGDSERSQFDGTELARAVQLCIETGNLQRAGKLVNLLVETAATKEQAALAAELGVRAGYPHLGVRGAKKALQNNTVLVDIGYPTPKTPHDIPIERALALAIMRQESEFDPQAKSSARAMGLMQLLPSTAKEMAKKLEMRYAINSLYDPEYNATLGSHYLSRLINGYDGSYIMAIAAYNAGPGNVRGWIKEFGTPGSALDGAVNWIEKIPFAETRNYVQRVMENLQVYRHIEAKGDTPKLQLEEDLTR